MEFEGLKRYFKYFYLVVIILLAYISWVIVKPYIISVLSALVLAYIFYPIYTRLLKIVRNKNIASMLMIIIIILLAIVPSFFLIKILLSHSIQFSRSIDIEGISGIFGEGDIKDYVKEGINRVVNFIIIKSSDFILSIPAKILNFFVLLFILFYSFKDGDRFVSSIKNNIPLNNKDKELVIREFRGVTKAVVYGFILTGIIEGVIGGLVFYLFNVKSAALWGVVIGILTVLPAVGASIVWIPAGIVKLVNGELVNGIGILAAGALFVSSIEVFLRPKLIGKKSKVHPVLILVGVLGGIEIFGFIGILFGPLFLVLLITFIKSYLK